MSKSRAALAAAIGLIAVGALTFLLVRTPAASFSESLPETPPKPADRFTTTLLQNRHALSIKEGQLSGSGAQLLKSAIARSRFVLVGENHGFAQTSAFTAAVCNAAGQDGLDAMAVEEGPLIADALERWVRQPDGLTQAAAFVKTFRGTINLSSTHEEYQMLQACTRANAGQLDLWGLNQEAPGAAPFMLSRIAEGELGKQSSAEIQRLLRKSRDEDRKAGQAGNAYAEPFMVSADDADLARVAAVLQKDGSAEAQSLFASFIESHEINSRMMLPETRQRRAQLMERLFMADYASAERSAGAPPKVLLKLGAYHIYRGANPAGGSGIGTFIAALGEKQDAQSLHIRVLPVEAVKSEPGSGYLRPIVDHLLQTDWTLYDLRPLRQGFNASAKAADRQWDRLVAGIDILVMVPDASRSTRIE